MKRRSLVVGKPKLSPASLQVSDRRGPSGGGGLLLEDMTGGASPTSIATGYLLLEGGGYLLLE